MPRFHQTLERTTDEELSNFYEKNDILAFTGKKGTIFAVDTRGLHIGKPLVIDNRLLFQVHFSNSLFGAPCDSLSISNPADEEKSTIYRCSKTFQPLN
ncbi:MAG: hypothetical protein ACI865_002123 [Flavobacteriaceae bacterium]|jgi:hypothetical protein